MLTFDDLPLRQKRATVDHRDGLDVLDLFAGAGGLSLGFHTGSLRYRTVQAVEQNLAAAATFTENFGDIVYPGDIANWLEDEVVLTADVVLGGPPCQGFSLIGRRDPSDLRNTLWKPYVEALRRATPRVFVMENVPGFLRSGEYAAFIAMFATGELADYEIQARVLNAADFGAPQVRKRAFVIGVRRDLAHPGHPPARLHDRSTVREAFAGIRPFAGDYSLPPRKTIFKGAWLPGPFRGQDLHVTRAWSALTEERIRAVPYGGSRLDLPDELMMDCWRRSPGSAGDVMGRLEWDKPSVTVRTEFFKPEKGRFLHPTQHRAITHWEAARLQGFPDDFRWVGDRAQIARQIGNAVPVQLAHAVGAHVAQVL